MEIDTGTTELLCAVRDGVALITLNRPEARNAMSDRLTPALRTQIKERGEDPDVGAHPDHRRRHRLLQRRRRQGHGRPRPARPDELRGTAGRPAPAPGGADRRAGGGAQADHRGAARRGGRRGPCHRARLRHPHRRPLGVRQHGLCPGRPVGRLRHRLAADPRRGLGAGPRADVHRRAGRRRALRAHRPGEPRRGRRASCRTKPSPSPSRWPRGRGWRCAT